MNEQISLFEPASVQGRYENRPAETARDAGIAKVEDNDKALGIHWKARALDLLPQYPHRDGTGEDFRVWLESRLGPMHHPNLMGAVIRCALNRSLIARTGERRRMKEKKSHARMTDVYQIQQP